PSNRSTSPPVTPANLRDHIPLVLGVTQVECISLLASSYFARGPVNLGIHGSRTRRSRQRLAPDPYLQLNRRGERLQTQRTWFMKRPRRPWEKSPRRRANPRLN